jgi:hypothetical protein
VERVFVVASVSLPVGLRFCKRMIREYCWRCVFVLFEVPRGFSVDLDVFVGSYVLERIVKQYKKDYFGNLC